MHWSLPSASMLTIAMQDDWQTSTGGIASKSQKHIFSPPAHTYCGGAQIASPGLRCLPFNPGGDQWNLICGSRIFWAIRGNFPGKMLRSLGQFAGLREQSASPPLAGTFIFMLASGANLPFKFEWKIVFFCNPLNATNYAVLRSNGSIRIHISFPANQRFHSWNSWVEHKRCKCFCDYWCFLFLGMLTTIDCK